MFCRRIRSCPPRAEARQLWRAFDMAAPLQCPEVRSCRPRKGCSQGVMLQGVILFKGGYAGVTNAVTVDCQFSTVCLPSRR